MLYIYIYTCVHAHVRAQTYTHTRARTDIHTHEHAQVLLMNGKAHNSILTNTHTYKQFSNIQFSQTHTHTNNDTHDAKTHKHSPTYARAQIHEDAGSE